MDIDINMVKKQLEDDIKYFKVNNVHKRDIVVLINSDILSKLDVDSFDALFIINEAIKVYQIMTKNVYDETCMIIERMGGWFGILRYFKENK